MGSFRAWESWAIYPSDFLTKLQNIFLGLVRIKVTSVSRILIFRIENLKVFSSLKNSKDNESKRSNIDDDIDGRPINSDGSDNRTLALVADYDDEEDIDGKPITKPPSSMDDDIDGRPIDSWLKRNLDFDGFLIMEICFSDHIPSRNEKEKEKEKEKGKDKDKKSNSNSAAKPRFVPTKWESIEPDRVTAPGLCLTVGERKTNEFSSMISFSPAVTSSKWDVDNEINTRPTESLYEDLAEKSYSTDNSNSNHSSNNE